MAGAFNGGVRARAHLERRRVRIPLDFDWGFSYVPDALAPAAGAAAAAVAAAFLLNDRSVMSLLATLSSCRTPIRPLFYFHFFQLFKYFRSRSLALRWCVCECGFSDFYIQFKIYIDFLFLHIATRLFVVVFTGPRIHTGVLTLPKLLVDWAPSPFASNHYRIICLCQQPHCGALSPSLSSARFSSALRSASLYLSLAVSFAWLLPGFSPAVSDLNW